MTNDVYLQELDKLNKKLDDLTRLMQAQYLLTLSTNPQLDMQTQRSFFERANSLYQIQNSTPSRAEQAIDQTIEGNSLDSRSIL